MEISCAVQVDCSDIDIVVVKVCSLVHYLFCELTNLVQFTVDVLSVLGQCVEKFDCIVTVFVVVFLNFFFFKACIDVHS